MAKVQGRIRYVENWELDPKGGEWYLFEIFRKDTQDWGLDTAYPLSKDGEMINYRALTHVRQWQNLGIDFHFGE